MNYFSANDSASLYEQVWDENFTLQISLMMEVAIFAIIAAGAFSHERNHVSKSIDPLRPAYKQAVISLAGHYL